MKQSGITPGTGSVAAFGACLAVLATILFLSTCKIYGDYDNPADMKAANYQGFPSSTSFDSVAHALPAISAGSITRILVPELIGASAYDIRMVSDSANPEASVVKEASGVGNALDLPLQYLAASKYYYQFKAQKDGAWTAWSDLAAIDITAYAPSGASPADGASTTDTTPTLSWTAGSGETSWVVQTATSLANLDASSLLTLTSTSITSDSVLAFGTTLYWRVAPKADSGLRGWSKVYTVTVSNWSYSLAPVSPADDVTISDTTPLLDWNDITDAASYEVEVVKSATTLDGTAASTVTRSQYTVPAGLEQGTWYWRVRAKNADGLSGAWSAIWSYSISLTVPTLSAPANAATIPDTTPDLSWAALTGATAYRIQLSSDSGFATIVSDVPTLTAATYTQATALSNNETYYWRVAQKNADGVWSDFSMASSFTLDWNPTISITAPANAGTITATTPLLDWADATGAASYEIQIADTSAGVSTATAVTSTSSQYQVATALANGATMYWRVRPINADGVAGGWGSTWSFTVTLPVPTLSAPANTATITDTTPDLSWATLTGATAYRVQLASDSLFATIVSDVSTLTAATYTPATALSNNATYYWRVAQKNADGVWSSFSTASSFTLGWNPTISITAPANAGTTTATTPLLDWADATGAASYEIQVADTSAGVSSATAVTSPGSQYQVPTAYANGATKYWRVRPINADGVAGNWGSTWNFTVSVSAGVTVVDGSGTLSVSLAGGLDPLLDGATMTLTATTTPAAISYAWYLDGKVIAGQTGAGLALAASGIALGQHSVLCLAASGQETGSAVFGFSREEISYSAVPRNGLVAEYLFSGNANDSSGNGLNGTSSAVTSTVDRFGFVSRSFGFNGSGSNVTVANDLRFLPANFTWSLWVKPAVLSASAYSTLISVSSNPRWQLHTLSSYRLHMGLKTSYWFVDNAQFAVGTWSHVVWSYNGSSVDIYQNGVLKSSSSYSGGVPSITTPLMIGNDVSSQAFNGSIDDVRVYNRALTASEIQTLYHEGGWTGN